MMFVAVTGWLVEVFGKSIPSVAEGVAHLRQGRPEKARQIAQSRISRDRQDFAAWQLLGQAEEAVQNYRQAAEAYKHACQSEGPRWNWQVRYAMTLLQSGQLEQAEKQFRSLHAERPDDEPVRTELQWMLFNQLRERELEQFLEECLTRSPGNFQIVYHLLYSSQRRPVAQEAVGLLERANAAEPNQGTVELALGHCCWKLGNADRARILLESAHGHLNCLESALLLADFLLEQGDAARADQLMQPPANAAGSVLDRDDRWWWFQCRRALDQKRLDEALQAISEAAERRPGEVRYSQTKATILQALGRTADAATAREQSGRLANAERELYIIVSRGDLDHPTPTILQDVARHCRELGKTNQALAWDELAHRLEAIQPGA